MPQLLQIDGREFSKDIGVLTTLQRAVFAWALRGCVHDDHFHHDYVHGDRVHRGCVHDDHARRGCAPRASPPQLAPIQRSRMLPAMMGCRSDHGRWKHVTLSTHQTQAHSKALNEALVAE